MCDLVIGWAMGLGFSRDSFGRYVVGYVVGVM